MHLPGCKKYEKLHYSTSSEQIKYIRFTEIRLCIFFEVECAFVILNWKISLCVFSCDRTSKELTVNGFEDILTLDGSIKKAKGIKIKKYRYLWFLNVQIFPNKSHASLKHEGLLFVRQFWKKYFCITPKFVCKFRSVILNITKSFLLLYQFKNVTKNLIFLTLSCLKMNSELH